MQHNTTLSPYDEDRSFNKPAKLHGQNLPNQAETSPMLADDPPTLHLQSQHEAVHFGEGESYTLPRFVPVIASQAQFTSSVERKPTKVGWRSGNERAKRKMPTDLAEFLLGGDQPLPRNPQPLFPSASFQGGPAQPSEASFENKRIGELQFNTNSWMGSSRSKTWQRPYGWLSSKLFVTLVALIIAMLLVVLLVFLLVSLPTQRPF